MKLKANRQWSCEIQTPVQLSTFFEQFTRLRQKQLNLHKTIFLKLIQ